MPKTLSTTTSCAETLLKFYGQDVYLPLDISLTWTVTDIHPCFTASLSSWHQPKKRWLYNIKEDRDLLKVSVPEADRLAKRCSWRPLLQTSCWNVLTHQHYRSTMSNQVSHFIVKMPTTILRTVCKIQPAIGQKKICHTPPVFNIKVRPTQLNFAIKFVKEKNCNSEVQRRTDKQTEQLQHAVQLE